MRHEYYVVAVVNTEYGQRYCRRVFTLDTRLEKDIKQILAIEEDIACTEDVRKAEVVVTNWKYLGTVL